MTDGVSLAEALADKSALGSYQGEPVLKTTIKLTKAGDGLSKALGIDPQLLPVGSKGMLLVGYEVVQHNHKRIPDTTAFELAQVLEATTVTVTSTKDAEKALERQRRKNEEAAMAAKNVKKLENIDGSEFETDGDLDPVEGDESEPDLSAFNGDGETEGDESE